PPAGRRPALRRRSVPRPQPHRSARPALPPPVARGSRPAALDRRRAAQGGPHQPGAALWRAVGVPPRPAPASAGAVETVERPAAAAPSAALLADPGVAAAGADCALAASLNARGTGSPARPDRWPRPRRTARPSWQTRATR